LALLYDRSATATVISLNKNMCTSKHANSEQGQTYFEITVCIFRKVMYSVGVGL